LYLSLQQRVQEIIIDYLLTSTVSANIITILSELGSEQDR